MDAQDVSEQTTALLQDIEVLRVQLNAGQSGIKLPTHIAQDLVALKSRSAFLRSFARAPLLLGGAGILAGLGFYAVAQAIGTPPTLDTIHVPTEVLQWFSDSKDLPSSTLSSPWSELAENVSGHLGRLLAITVWLVGLGVSVTRGSVMPTVLAGSASLIFSYGPAIVFDITQQSDAKRMTERRAFEAAVEEKSQERLNSMLKGKVGPDYLKAYVELQASSLLAQTSGKTLDGEALRSFRRSVLAVDTAVEEGHFKGASGESLYVLEHVAFGHPESRAARAYHTEREARRLRHQQLSETFLTFGILGATLGGLLLGMGALLKRRLTRITQLAGWSLA